MNNTSIFLGATHLVVVVSFLVYDISRAYLIWADTFIRSDLYLVPTDGIPVCPILELKTNKDINSYSVFSLCYLSMYYTLRQTAEITRAEKNKEYYDSFMKQYLSDQ